MKEFQGIIDAVAAGNIKKTRDLVRQAISEGINYLSIVNEGLTEGLKVVGGRFKVGELFLPEMMLSAIAARAGIEAATENLEVGEYQPKGTIVMGTVKGDLHDLGKNLVALFLKARGLKVIDLGVDVHEEEFVSAVRVHKPELLGLSCLMTTTMKGMTETMEALVEAGLRDSVKVIVGGCPVNEDFACQIGANGYGRDAAMAADLVESLLSKAKLNKPPYPSLQDT